RARFTVEVGPDPAGDTVTWLLGANPGEPLLPLAKVASGGELARAMLAVRLVLTEKKTRAANKGTPSSSVSSGADRPGRLRGTSARPNGQASTGAIAAIAADAAAVADGVPTLIFDD